MTAADRAVPLDDTFGRKLYAVLGKLGGEPRTTVTGGGHVGGAGDRGYPATATAQQRLGRQPPSGEVVGGDVGQRAPTARWAAGQHHRHPLAVDTTRQRVAGVHREEHDAVDVPGRGILLQPGAVVLVGDDDE